MKNWNTQFNPLIFLDTNLTLKLRNYNFYQTLFYNLALLTTSMQILHFK